MIITIMTLNNNHYDNNNNDTPLNESLYLATHSHSTEEVTASCHSSYSHCITEAAINMPGGDQALTLTTI
eukprot:COSAG03_NODE_178_length_11063_cov_43.316951_3_plen_70_part_00